MTKNQKLEVVEIWSQHADACGQLGSHENHIIFGEQDYFCVERARKFANGGRVAKRFADAIRDEWYREEWKANEN